MIQRVLLVLCVLLVIVPGVLVLLSVLWVRLWKKLLAVPEFFDEIVTVPTADGGHVRLGHCLPAGEPSKLPPVVLCHGLAMNRRAMALDTERSLARHFKDLGREVWAVELRRPNGARGGSPAVSFDTHAVYDLPAVLAHVCKASGTTAVDWVGFSMGGMLAYAHLGALQGGSIRRLVTIGSPMRFNEVAERVAPLSRLLGLTRRRARTPFGFMATLVAPWMWPGMPRVFHRGLSGEHYEAHWMRRVMANAMSDAPTGVTEAFARWVRDDTLTSDDGTRDYREGIELVSVPSLVIAGSHDNLAPPSSVRFAHDRIGAKEKRYVEVGKATGARSDYDHLDLILGRWSHEEVFPHVIDWLER